MLTIRKGGDNMKLQDKYNNKKIISSREMIQLLKANGFDMVRNNGDHKIFKKDDKTVAVNMGNLNRMVARRIIRENNLLETES